MTIPTSCIQIKHKHNKKKTLMVLPIGRSTGRSFSNAAFHSHYPRRYLSQSCSYNSIIINMKIFADTQLRQSTIEAVSTLLQHLTQSSARLQAPAVTQPPPRSRLLFSTQQTSGTPRCILKMWIFTQLTEGCRCITTLHTGSHKNESTQSQMINAVSVIIAHTKTISGSYISNTSYSLLHAIYIIILQHISIIQLQIYLHAGSG